MATTPTLVSCAGEWGTTAGGSVTCTGEVQPVTNVPLSTLTFAQANDLLTPAIYALVTAGVFRLLIQQIRNR